VTQDFQLEVRPQAGFAEGEFDFTLEDFRAIANTLHKETGIFMPESKSTLVYSRLTKRLRKLGFASFKQYRKFLASPEGAEERIAMMSALTTNLTKFYREPHHFDLLRRQVLEPRAAEVRAGAPLRIWSAACSTGEEAYSIALTVLQVFPNAPDLDVKILATDIDPVVVRKASEGRYSESSVEPIPSALLERWFGVEGARGHQTYIATPEMRSLIAFKELNLIGPWPMKGKFDAIYCRNCVIYFNDETQAALWPRFAAALKPYGRLYIGHSERVSDLGFESDGLTAYRLKAQRAAA
jgi:chemotaxis protein methyltransferase CheR